MNCLVVLLVIGFTQADLYSQNTNPTFTSTPITTVNDNARYLYVISTVDNNEDDVTVTATTIPGWLTLSNEPLVSTFAGSGTLGDTEGTGTMAQFFFPYAIAVDVSGNVYVADTHNKRIRKISTDGVVTTLAGSGTLGDTDGTGTEAQFGSPEGIAVDAIGNVYVADRSYHNIRKISPGGVVTTLAGTFYNIYAGDSQSRDGAGTIATFNEPKGLAVDGAGNLYVADSGNNRIRKISPSGMVTTLAGSGYGFVDGTGTAAQFRTPTGVAVDGSGNVFVADSNNRGVRKISSAGVVTTLASILGSGLVSATGIAIDNFGNILVADEEGNKIQKISPSGAVSTLAGSGGYDFARGLDGAASEAKFNEPTGVAVDVAGNVFVVDRSNHKIRKIEFPEYLLYGDATDQKAGNQNVILTADDANGGTVTQNFSINVVDVTEPYFNSITGLPANFVENGTGRAYYVSTYDANDVTTSLGTSNDEALFNISGENVTFKTLPDFEDPKDENKDNVYVIEIKANDGVFEITEIVTITVTDYDDKAPVFSSGIATSFAENGTGIAYTIATTDSDSDASAVTYSLGTANDEALFNIVNNEISFKLAPDYEMATDGGTDNTYVVNVIATDETGNSSNQDVTITVTNVNDNDPVFTSSAVTAVNDNASYSYVVTTNDPDGDKVTVSAPTLPNWLSLEYSTSNIVSTLAGAGSGYADGIGTALFAFPNSIAVNAQGYIYVAEEKRIRKVSPDGTVSTLAGNGTTGSVDGTGTAAMFEDNPGGITVDATGNLYVIDNNKVRKITPEGVVTTFAVSEYSYLTNIAIDGSGNLYVSVIADNKVLKLSPSGVFTTFAGSTLGFADGTGTQAQFKYPAGLATDALGNVYVADQGNDRIRKITPDGVVSTFAGSSTGGHLDGTGTAAFFSGPLDIAFDVNGNLYVADQYNGLLRMISPDAVVSTLAGGGSGDGTGTAAEFLNIYGITVDALGNLYAADLDNHSIRKLAGELKLTGYPTGQILTPQNVVLTASDGDGRTATQNFTITVNDATDPVFTSATSASFAENTFGTAYTIAATDAHTVTYRLGTSMDEDLFDLATDVVTFKTSPDFESPGDGDTDNTYLIEVIANDGINEVSQTVAITVTNVNETIQFTSTPVTQINDNSLYKYLIATNDIDGDDAIITTTALPSWLTLETGTVETENFVGSPRQRGDAEGVGSAARFDTPNGIAIDAVGNFYVSDWGNNRISKVTPHGLVSAFVGNGSAATVDGTGTNASFNRPGALEFDSQGNLYVTEYDGHAIRKITPAGVVSTFAGSGSPGSANGTGTTASFIHPGGIAIDTNDNLFVADAANHLIRKITPTGVVSTFAGSGIVSNVLGYGDGTFADGTGTSASFNFPLGIAIDSQGNLYVADAGNLVIRKITPGAVVTNHIGVDIFTLIDRNISPSGYFSGGTGTDAFFQGTPVDVALDQNDNLFIIERDGSFGFNNALLKADVNGVLETVAGRAGFGTQDGTGTNAQFDGPSGLVINGWGNIYIAESNSNRVRKVIVEKVLEGNPAGQVGVHNVTLNASDGNGESDTQSFTITVKDGSILTFSSAATVNFDENSTGPAYITTTINKIPDAVTTYSLGTGSDNLLFDIAPTTGEVTFKSVPDFENPTDSDLDGIYVIKVHATDGDNVVFQEVIITVTNVNEALNFTSTPVTTVDEDKPYSYRVTTSDEDGDLVTIAAPGLPQWLSLSSESTDIVSAIAGNGSAGLVNGMGTLAQFEEPTAIAVDVKGNVYVADNQNYSVRKIAPSGFVTTLAGNGKYGFADGTGTAAQFKDLEGIALDHDGNLYVVDNGDHRIRKISPSGVVTTFAGSGNRASTDGTGTSAEFNSPIDIAIDNVGNFYISETRKIRKITPDGVVSTIAGNASSGDADGTGTSAEFDNPHGLAIDAAGNVFVADRRNDNIRKITPEGIVSTLAGSGSSDLVDGTGTAAEFDGPRGLTIDTKGNLYVADFWNNSIRKVTPEGVVSTLAGDGTSGFFNGTGTSARFDRPTGLAIDIAGNLYVADRDNHSIRKLQGKQLLVGDPIGQSSSQSVTLNATDGKGGADTQSFTIMVNDIYPPNFTSPANLDFAENGTGTAYAALATDANAVTYSIDAGQDGAKFDIAGSTGVVTFKSAPDYEKPTDIGADNTYIINVIATDNAGNSDNIDVTITVTNVNEAPVFTTGVSGDFTENGTGFAFSLWAEDDDTNTSLTYSLGTNNDEAHFSISESVGLISFKVSPDFENPVDADGQNDYVLEAKVTDGVNVVSQTLVIHVIDANDVAPVFRSTSTVSFAEKGTGTVYQIDATDVDSDNLIYSLGQGNDESLFTVTDGLVTFKIAPDFETPGGNNGDNTYVINVIASDGLNSANQNVTITVTELKKDIAPPSITHISDDTGSSTTDGVTSDRNILVYGTAEAGVSVDVFSPGGKIGTVQADTNGDWMLDISRFNLPQFTAVMTAEAFDPAGNRSPASDPFTLTIDFTAPAKPVITRISDDTGSSATDGVTSDPNILVYGTAEAGVSVDVFSPGGKIGTVQADANGDWMLDITRFNLPQFTANMTAEAFDLAGNRSAASDQFTLTIDFTAPTKPAITRISDDTGSSATDGVTSDRNLLVYGTAEAGVSVDVFSPGGKIGTVQADANGEWMLDISQFNLPQFTTVMTAEAFDLAGNRSAASDPFTLTIDFTAPAKPAITRISDDTGSSANDGVTSDRNILVYGTAEAGANVDVFSPGGKVGTVQVDSNGDWILDISRFNLPQFTANMTAEAFDLAGNRSAASDPFTLTIDFTAPARPAITRISDDTGMSATDGVTSDRNILVYGTAEAGVNVDVFSPGGKIGTVLADANGDWMLDISRFNLPQFTAKMTAEAFDLAGNRSETSDPFTLIIDFTGPDVTIDPASNSAAGYLINAIFNEEVNGLTLEEITVTGGTVSDLVQNSATSYSFLVNSSGGTVDVTINANAAEDLAGNGNRASNQLSLGLTLASAREDFTNLQRVSKTEEINIYPNPASKVLTIDLSELSAEAVDIRMHDASGTPVFTRKAYKQQTLKLDVSNYTSGMYIVQVYDGEQIIRKKVMVRK